MKRMICRIHAALLVLLLVPVAVHAQDGGTDSIFKLGAGSRGMALGNSFVSLVDDASAVYWNPAALKNVGQTEFMAMYMPVFGDFTGANYTYFAFVYPTLSAGAFGIAYMGLGGATFDAYDEQSRPLGEGSGAESQLLFSYAFERHSGWVLGTLATGASFKINHQSVDPYSSTSAGVDLGFRWVPDAARSLSVGVNLQDLVAPEYKLNLAKDPGYRSILLGAGWTRRFDNGSALRLMLQYDMPEVADSRFHAGAEYVFSRLVALRVGYDNDVVTFGLGVGAFNYGLDYAFYSRDEAGATQAVTFSARFGQSLDEKRAEITAQRAAEEQELIRRTFEARVAAHRKAAQDLEGKGDWAGALSEWRIVLEYAPDDADAIAASDAAREKLAAQQAAAVRDVENQTVIQTRFSRGLELFNQNDLLGARGEWLAILQLDPGNQGAKDYLAQTNTKIDQAVREHVASAHAMEADGRLTEAIAEWNNVQQYDPQNAEAGAAITRIRARIESVSQDYATTQRRLRIVTLYNDALQDYNATRYSDAMGKLKELLSLQPDHADARKLQALTKRRMTPLTDQEKARVREFYLAGMQHFSKDEYAQAITEWQKILDIDPTNESVQRSIDEARERLRKTQERK